MRRFLSILLLLSMLLALTACGGAAEEDASPSVSQPYEAPPAPASDTEAATEEEASAPAAEPITVTAPEGTRIAGTAARNGRLWVSLYNVSEDEPWFGVGASANTVCSVDMATGALTEVCGREDGGIAAFSPAEDGTVWVLVNNSLSSFIPPEGDDFSVTLYHLGPDNKVIGSLDVDELADDGSGFAFTALADGGAAVGWDGTAAVVDAQGKTVRKVPMGNSCFMDLTRLEDGTVVGSCWNGDDMGQFLSYSTGVFDTAAGTVTDLPQGDMQGETAPACGDGTTIWCSGFGGVQAYDRAAGTMGETMDWINLGFQSLYVTGLFLRDGAPWAAVAAEDGCSLTVRPLPTGDDGRTVLTLACFFEEESGMIARAVRAFNQTDPDYRVQVTDYGTIEDDPLSRFNNDVIAGDMPDLISLYEMPYDTLLRQGLLADLTDYIENDPDVRREDYLDWTWQASTGPDGGIYSLIPQFVFSSWFCREGYLTKDEFTLDKYLDLADSGEALDYANGDGPFYRASEAANLISCNMDLFVDLQSGQCHFDSPEFRRIVDTAEHMTILTGDTYGQEVIRVGQLGSYEDHTYATGDGRTVPIGYPTPAGGVYRLSPRTEAAMSSQTEHPEGCWRFLRTLLLDELQCAPEGYGSYQCFPAKRSGLDVMAAAELEMYSDMPPEAMAAGGDGLTQAGIDAVNAILDQGDIFVDRLFTSLSSAVTDILEDELEAYYGGGSDMDSLISSLQSRVGLYVSEQS